MPTTLWQHRGMGEYGCQEFSSPHVSLVWWATFDEDTDHFEVANEWFPHGERVSSRDAGLRSRED